MLRQDNYDANNARDCAQPWDNKLYIPKGHRIFDYPKFAEPFKEVIRANAERIAKDQGIEIEFIRKSGVRKESNISDIINKRGNHPGIVHILSVM